MFLSEIPNWDLGIKFNSIKKVFFFNLINKLLKKVSLIRNCLKYIHLKLCLVSGLVLKSIMGHDMMPEQHYGSEQHCCRGKTHSDIFFFLHAAQEAHTVPIFHLCLMFAVVCFYKVDICQ